MTQPALLGIDGGGTSTTVWLADEKGVILGRGRAGPSNMRAVGIRCALLALDEAVALAVRDAGTEAEALEVACLGLAGADRTEEKVELRAWAERRSLARRLLLVNDGDLVLAAASKDGCGAAVISGTGSIAVGRGRDGTMARAGGWGHLFGDEGSAYAVVLAALRLVARRADGREGSSPAPPP
jgi:N-acetylglucosamine kinase-like BadF-type ATPase